MSLPVYSVTVVQERTIPSKRHRRMTHAQAYANVVSDYLEGADREHLVVLPFDSGSKLLGLHTAHIGDLTSAHVHPREVFKVAIASNAHHVVIAHNHPSGEPWPSDNDQEVTKRLWRTGKVLDIELVDHIITGNEKRYFSFAQHGFMRSLDDNETHRGHVFKMNEILGDVDYGSAGLNAVHKYLKKFPKTEDDLTEFFKDAAQRYVPVNYKHLTSKAISTWMSYQRDKPSAVKDLNAVISLASKKNFTNWKVIKEIIAMSPNLFS